MIDLPGGRWFEPADTGFDNTAVAAAAGVTGNILPWCAGSVFSRVVFFVEIVSGTAPDVTLQARSFDIDGQTVLTVEVSVVSNILVDTVSFFSANSSIARGGLSGTVNSNAFGRVTGSPYVRMRILNNNGAEVVNVTLRVLLGF